MEVKLSGLSGSGDFISPSLACVKPMQIDKTKPNRVLRLEGLQDDDGAQPAPIAKVTLNDCLACSGCITSAETVLVTQQSITEFMRCLNGSAHVVISLSPAARAAIATHCGLSLREAHGRLTGFFKSLGCHRVLDNGLASDLSLLQTAAEFVHRFRSCAAAASASGNGAGVGGCVTSGAAIVRDADALPLPLLSSSCPGWICYAEKVQGAHVLPHLSRVKSSQQIMGTLVKYGYGAERGLPPQSIYHVSIMPCFDKKLEASRDDFFNPAAGADGSRDVDCVLSSAEVIA